MGENWVKVRNGAGDGTLRATTRRSETSPSAGSSSSSTSALGSARTSAATCARCGRASRPRGARLEANGAALAETGMLEAAIRVPDAVGPLVVQADLRTRKVITSVDGRAPGEGRPATRVNWLLRQLKEAPDGLRRSR